MCRNIKNLFNFEPPATDAELRAASRQFVRKVSGMTQPSRQNEAAFEAAVDDIAVRLGVLIKDLVTSTAPKDSEVEAAKARKRWTDSLSKQTGSLGFTVVRGK